ncbi:GMC family oxidoreductase [Kitasatospora sp. NBC_00240]|uniref:GMC family oxidoreductase n=1 Tax=Kitasatospora sp. NBC_00240 TaxID=2903567 RepID=UPI00225640BD|nr:GMC family oxidoreductase [Kitasatospora sp. NBC_00240]MCX5214324.1 GMC family oxidoreductase [Kitasatospora sp. NBC_00240]
MSTNDYDIVIVGGGISAATVAKTVIEQAAAQVPPRHPRILVLEAGRATAMSADKYDSYVEAYQGTVAKVPNAPYPASGSAPQPDVLDIGRPVMGPDGTTRVPSDNGYFVQMGPLPFGSDYTRSLGGTTLHWLGTCLRMLPNDFRMKTEYGRGRDWPLGYEDLKPYYERAEWDIIGVSANVEDQVYPGIGGDPEAYFRSADRNRFPDGVYHFPMERIPSSYLDRYLAKKSAGLVVGLTDRNGVEHAFPIKISNTPVGRNSQPAKGYQVVGAVGNADHGQRCEGNSSCIPICPVQAKYNALKTLYELIVKYPDREPEEGAPRKARFAVRSQCVVSRVRHTQQPGRTGTVTGLTFTTYFDDGSAPVETTVTADRYVLAANAVENATLLLASGAANNSDQVGRNLMDHPLLLTWGMFEDSVGAFRGPGSTSGIPAFRDGSFRSERTAFRVEIGNWGWNFPENAPYDTVQDLVGGGESGQVKLYGKELRKRLGEILPRQFRIAWELEQDPEPTNRVTIDDRWKDSLGNHRPVIHYDLSPYMRASLPWAAEASRQLFAQLGIADKVRRPEYRPGDYTHYDPNDPSAVTYEGVTYWVRGAGHVVGTHRMGEDPATSVVDSHQRSHDLPNLYIVGCGSMPTLGTSNPTLTMTALAIRTGDRIAEQLKGTDA